MGLSYDYGNSCHCGEEVAGGGLLCKAHWHERQGCHLSGEESDREPEAKEEAVMNDREEEIWQKLGEADREHRAGEVRTDWAKRHPAPAFNRRQRQVLATVLAWLMEDEPCDEPSGPSVEEIRGRWGPRPPGCPMWVVEAKTVTQREHAQTDVAALTRYIDRLEEKLGVEP